MFLKKIVFTICVGGLLCAIQAINIRGVVKNSTGANIAGATVKLETENLSTTTGTDGSFTLISSAIKQITNPLSLSPVYIQKGKLTIVLLENRLVTITIHNSMGRKIFSTSKMYGRGTHTLPSFRTAAGIQVYTVTIDKKTYFFKSIMGTFSSEAHSASDNISSYSLAKQENVWASFSDIISITKAGQINYRDSIRTSDTTGIVIKMIPNAGNLTDVEGNVYQTVQIGNQVWMVDNLRVTKYNDGSAIPHVQDETEWGSLTTPGYCFYDNTTDTVEQQKWGALYNWYTVSSQNTKKIAPTGWRVPTNDDWTALINYLIANGYNWDGTTTDCKVAKAMAAKTYWKVNNNSGVPGNESFSNNTCGFSALPGGCRILSSMVLFQYQKSDCYWWSASEADATNAPAKNMAYDYEGVIANNYGKKFGFSVRLLKN